MWYLEYRMSVKSTLSFQKYPVHHYGHQEESGRHVRVIFFLARSEVTFSLPCIASSNKNNNVVAESAHAEERAGPGRKMPVKR